MCGSPVYLWVLTAQNMSQACGERAQATDTDTDTETQENRDADRDAARQGPPAREQGAGGHRRAAEEGEGHRKRASAGRWGSCWPASQRRHAFAGSSTLVTVSCRCL